MSVKKEKALSSNTGKQDKQDILPMKKIRLYEKCKVHFFFAENSILECVDENRILYLLKIKALTVLFVASKKKVWKDTKRICYFFSEHLSDNLLSQVFVFRT